MKFEKNVLIYHHLVIGIKKLTKARLNIVSGFSVLNYIFLLLVPSNFHSQLKKPSTNVLQLAWEDAAIFEIEILDKDKPFAPLIQGWKIIK